MSLAPKNLAAVKPVTPFTAAKAVFTSNVMAEVTHDIHVASPLAYEADRQVEPADRQVVWEEEADDQVTYTQTKAFGELDPALVYKVTPVKVIVRKYGPQLLLEVEEMDSSAGTRPESFPVFAPNNYRERVKKLCGSTMTPHMLKYNGMEFKNNRKIHSYKIGSLQQAASSSHSEDVNSTDYNGGW